MNTYTANIVALFERVENYGKTTQELLNLKIVDKSSNLISTYITQIVIAIFAVFFIVSINIGVAIWIGELLGKLYYGFLLIGMFYGMVGYVLYIFRNKWLKVPINNFIITEMLKR